MFHQEFGLSRQRAMDMRTEVEHNRLEALLARAARSDEGNVARRGRVARGAALVTALFR